MQLNLLRAKQVNFNKNIIMTGDKNIMVILSSPSGVGKQLLQKKSNKNISLLKFQFP